MRVLSRERPGERGRITLVSLLLLSVVAAAVYGAFSIGPAYLENMRVKRLIRQATAYWLNVNPDIEETREKLAIDLQQAMVTAISSEDVEFERVDSNEVNAYVYYEVVVEHPALLEPTVLDFEFEHTEYRRLKYD